MEGCAIASPNMRPRRDVPQDGVRRNEMIRAREVRVIAADGTLGGYSAGTDRKQYLLTLEQHPHR